MFSLSFIVIYIINFVYINGQPVYPLYAIDSGKDTSNLTQQDIEIIATNFTFIQSVYSLKTLQSLHSINKDFKPVLYINSDVASQTDLEKDRFGCSYYQIASLPQSITSSQNTFNVTLFKIGSEIKPSTNPGNYSNSNGYVTFIRIKQELMKIVSVEAVDSSNNQQKIRVIRGFDNTKSSSYNININIFHPVYDGWNYPNGEGESHLNYVLDPTQSFGKIRLINHTLKAIQSGYNGSWFDCFSAFQFNAVDNNGNKLSDTWSFTLNTYFNRSTFALANQERLTYVLNETYKELGYYPIITANNIAGSYWSNRGNVKTFLEQDNKVKYKTNLNGYCLEEFAGQEIINNSYKEGCPVNGIGLILKWNSYKTWLNNVQEIMDASQNNLGIMPMIAQAGCKSIALEVVPSKERDAFEQFAYCSFLLGIEKMNGNTRLGIPPFYQNKNQTLRYAHVNKRYFYQIGNPIQTWNYINITNYRQNGKNSFQRYFENGLIIVNPTNITDKDFKLNGSYYNPDQQKYITSLDVVGQRGYILLNNINFL